MSLLMAETFLMKFKISYKKKRDLEKMLLVKKNDHTTGCLLDCTYLKESFKLIALELSKQQAIDSDTKAMQQIIFMPNLDRIRNRANFFLTEEEKKLF